MSRHLNAMVIEHSVYWTAVIQKVCKASGVNILDWSRNGEGWMPKFEAHKPHLVFVDLVMPNRDGLRICKDIIECNPATRIILFNGFHSQVANSFDNVALLMGVSAIAPKPFTDKKLLKIVGRVKDEVIALQKAMGLI